MMKVKGVFILSIVSVALYAQEAAFSVEISSDTVLLGNYFEVRYTVEGASANGFEAPDFDGLDIIGGPNTSSSISIVNGEMSQSASFTYYLQPRDIGNVMLPPAYLKTSEAELETPPIEVIIVPNPDGIEQLPHQAGKRFEQMPAPAPAAPESPKRPRRKI